MYRVEDGPPPAEEMRDIGRERMEGAVDDAGSARVRSRTLQMALTQRTAGQRCTRGELTSISSAIAAKSFGAVVVYLEVSLEWRTKLPV